MLTGLHLNLGSHSGMVGEGGGIPLYWWVVRSWYIDVPAHVNQW